jgi:hypothetical protein
VMVVNFNLCTDYLEVKRFYYRFRTGRENTVMASFFFFYCSLKFLDEMEAEVRATQRIPTLSRRMHRRSCAC